MMSLQPVVNLQQRHSLDLQTSTPTATALASRSLQQSSPANRSARLASLATTTLSLVIAARSETGLFPLPISPGLISPQDTSPHLPNSSGVVDFQCLSACRISNVLDGCESSCKSSYVQQFALCGRAIVAQVNSRRL